MVRMRHQATDRERENLGQTAGTGEGNGLTTNAQDVTGGYLDEQGDFSGSVQGNNTSDNVKLDGFVVYEDTIGLSSPNIIMDFPNAKRVNPRLRGNN